MEYSTMHSITPGHEASHDEDRAKLLDKGAAAALLVSQPEPPLEISIVICTHNRIKSLETLVAILSEQMQGLPVEMIVVDSASAPDQASAIRSLVERTAHGRLVRLDTPGLALARNAGLEHAKAPWIAFLDDDEVPYQNWLYEARRLIQRLPSNCAACGGNTLPIYPNRLEPRLSPRWAAYLSVISRSGEFDQTAAPTFPIGHSLVRRAALMPINGFDPRLGRIGGNLLSGEEVLLIIRLKEKKWTIWHSDRIQVGHHIEPERLTREWARKRAFWEGLTSFRVQLICDKRKLVRLILQTALKWPALRLASIVLGDRREIDLRLAFARGVQSSAVDYCVSRFNLRKKDRGV